MPIPEELKAIPKWVMWKKDAKKGKIPYSLSKRKASSTDPMTWSSFENVKKTILSNDKFFNGVGFVITKEDGYVFIDLDHAKDKDWAKEILARNKSYCEFSPSRTGYHIVVKGSKPGTACKRGDIEIYDDKRFFTITGKVVNGNQTIIEDQGLIDYVYGQMVGQVGKDASTPDSSSGEERQEVLPIQKANREEIENTIKKSKQCFKYQALKEGSWEGNYKSQSEAVGGFVSIISFYTNDWTVCDELFRASGLFSNKWLSKWSRHGRKFFNTAVDKFYKPSENGTGKDPGLYDRHINLVQDLYQEIRRDIFTDDLFVKNKQDEWQNVFGNNVINVLKAECHLRGKGFSHSKIESFLWKHLNELDRKLLVDIPVWDGQDRIAEMCSKLHFKLPITNEIFCDFFKDWCAKSVGKLKNPDRVQNRCILLSGSQGVGKDVWVQSLFCAARQYLADLTMQGRYTKESELAAVMAANFIVFISEFDKTEDLSIASLKDLITKPSFYFRQPYERKPLRYYNRASVIAACNPQNILRDATGNRRFLIFHLEGEKGKAIGWDYPMLDTEYSYQVLAQMWNLNQIGYKTQESSELLMETLIAAYTPECIEEDLVEIFEEEMGELISRSGRRFWQYKEGNLQRIVEKLSKIFDLKSSFVLKELKAHGCHYRQASGRFYSTKENCKNGKELLEIDNRTFSDGDVEDFLPGQADIPF